MRRFLALILAVSMITVLTINSSAADSASLNTNKVISACVDSEPKTIDPSIINAISAGSYALCAFEGLTTYDRNGNIVPGAAERWRVSPDGLTWTFYIRKDAKWSDGKSVTANDFVYSWRRLVAPETDADYAYYLFWVKNGEAVYSEQCTIEKLGVKAIDNTTLSVNLEYPCPFFAEIVSLPMLVPLRKDVVSANPDTWALNPKTYVGNGPYKLTSWDHDSKLSYSKNEFYWNKKDVIPQKIEWLLMDYDLSSISAFKTGKLVYTENINTEDIDPVYNDGTLKFYSLMGTYYLDLINNKPPFDNPKVRKAFSLAIDRNYIVKNVTMEGQLTASGLVPFGTIDTKPGTDFRSVGGELISTRPEEYEKNVAMARQLMVEAGYPDGKGFPKVTFSFNTDAGHEKIADAVKQMWEEKLGVQVEIVPEEWTEFQQSRQDGYYNIYGHSWIADSSDPALFLEAFTSWYGNNNIYINDKYDKLILASRYEKNPTKRMKLLHDAEKLLIDDAPIVPLYFYTTPALVSKKIKGIVKTRLGYVILRWTSYK